MRHSGFPANTFVRALDELRHAGLQPPLAVPAAGKTATRARGHARLGPKTPALVPGVGGVDSPVALGTCRRLGVHEEEREAGSGLDRPHRRSGNARRCTGGSQGRPGHPQDRRQSLGKAATAFRDPDGKRGETEGKNPQSGRRHSASTAASLTALAELAETVFSILGRPDQNLQAGPADPNRTSARSDEPDDVPDDAPAAGWATPPTATAEAPQPESVSDEVSPAPASGPKRPGCGSRPRARRSPVGTSRTGGPPPTTPWRGKRPRRSPHQPVHLVLTLVPSARPTNRPPTAVRGSGCPNQRQTQPRTTNREDRLKGLPEGAAPPRPGTRRAPVAGGALSAHPGHLPSCANGPPPSNSRGWFSMHQRSLVHRHLGPMVDAGLLELQFPDSPRSPRQAYRTRRTE